MLFYRRNWVPETYRYPPTYLINFPTIALSCLPVKYINISHRSAAFDPNNYLHKHPISVIIISFEDLILDSGGCWGTCRLRGVGYKAALLSPSVPTTSSVGSYVRVNSHLICGKQLMTWELLQFIIPWYPILFYFLFIISLSAQSSLTSD